jgi:hypothetical protein
METVIILLVAAGLSAAVVWWASMPPGTPLLPRRRPSSAESGFSPTLRESFQTTGPEPAPGPAAAPEDTFTLLPQAVPDDRPPRLISLIRLIFTIAFVAVLGVATLGLLGLLVKLQLDRYLGGS